MYQNCILKYLSVPDRISVSENGETDGMTQRICVLKEFCIQDDEFETNNILQIQAIDLLEKQNKQSLSEIFSRYCNQKNIWGMVLTFCLQNEQEVSMSVNLAMIQFVGEILCNGLKWMSSDLFEMGYFFQSMSTM